MQDNDLKHTLHSLEVPPPSESAKKQALAAAQQAFAAHQEKKNKGFVRPHRPIFSPTEVWEQLIGRFSMKRTYVFAGSMAAVATVLAITTTHYSTIMSPVIPLAQEKIQISEEKKPEPVAAAKSLDMVAAPSLREAESAQSNVVAPTAPVPMEMAAAAPPAPAKMKQDAKEEHTADMAAPPANNALIERHTASTVTGHIQAPQAPAQMLKAARPMEIDGKRNRAASSLMVMPEGHPHYQPPVVYSSADKFESFVENPVKLAKEEPVSTFSLDVDTSSYSFVRRALNGGQLPPRDAVRIEEMVNYFDYHYSVPESKENPFKPTVTIYPTPWHKDTKLVHIGIKGYDISKADKPRSNLVFLVDVSGSMNGPDRLPLVKSSLRMLVDQLQPDDTVGIVIYAGHVGTALSPTKISNKAQIIQAIENLGAGGSTAGASGIRMAYDLAQQHFDKKAVNRVILATDGDFNVGITDPTQLQDYIAQKRETGIFLSILGVGQGNYNDALMQKLAQNGNGTAAYIDNLNEARKLLVEEAGATLFTIAKDVKVQVEFNPAVVSEYRLIGYESRLLKREDFNNDKIDAGDVGSGHAVTAIYEITPVGSKTQSVDSLSYGQKTEAVKEEKAVSKEHNGEYAFLKIRYKLPDASESKLLTTPITSAQEVKDIQQASDDVRFSTAVAGFGQLLKGDTHIRNYSYDDVVSLADGARGKDAFGYRVEFLNMARLAKTMSGMQQPVPVPMQSVE